MLSHVQLCNPVDCSPPGSSVHGDSPGKNSELGCHALLQGIFTTQGFDPGLQHCRWILCRLSHQGSPRIMEWVTDSLSRGTSPPRNRTGVSCIASGFFISSATRETLSWASYLIFSTIGNLVYKRKIIVVSPSYGNSFKKYY